MKWEHNMPESQRIIVKFRRDQITVPYQDQAQLALTGADQTTWQALANQFAGATLNINRMLQTQTGSDLSTLLNAARTQSGEEPPDLFNIRAIEIDGVVDLDVLIPALRALPFVEFAYPETATEPAGVDPSNDPLTALEGYLLPAPSGIDAFFAWGVLGGDGAGVKFADVELGWDLSHEDLAGAGVTTLNQNLPSIDNEDHSSACLGIVLAQDNDKGGVGITPNVKGAIASANPTLGDGFVACVSFLEAGDVLLIEHQADGGIPVEIDPHVALLIRALTLLGIIVIEPAGNGAQNLDLLIRADGTTMDRTTPLFFDSGAVVVGARQATTRDRISLSSFGNRVDCHAWGEGIVTPRSVHSPQGLYWGLNPPAGNVGFGGTSGASAIIAGAAASTQGIARARNAALTPTAMRDLLSGSFNTPTINPGGIGVMPDLKEIAARVPTV
jgi:hypothetical protein